MPDRRFFTKSSSFTVEQLCAVCDASPGPNTDPGYVLSDVAPLDIAQPGELSFFDNIKYRDQFLATRAGACIVSQEWAGQMPPNTHAIVSKRPYRSYALAAAAFYPEKKPDGAFISPHSHIHPSARIGASCHIETGVVIEENVVIGDFCHISAHAVICRGVQIGNHSAVGAHATISHTVTGDHVRIYPGARIGQDGFGFAPDPAGHIKVPQLGRVIIGDHVEIGANTTIDRGAGPDTVIGQGTWIDNLVQIAHNVKIGKGCIIVAQVGIAGSSVIGDYSAFGGQAGVSGHLKIGAGVRVAAQSGIVNDIAPGLEVMGCPAIPIRQFWRQVATLKRLIRR